MNTKHTKHLIECFAPECRNEAHAALEDFAREGSMTGPVSAEAREQAEQYRECGVWVIDRAVRAYNREAAERMWQLRGMLADQSMLAPDFDRRVQQCIDDRTAALHTARACRNLLRVTR